MIHSQTYNTVFATISKSLCNHLKSKTIVVHVIFNESRLHLPSSDGANLRRHVTVGGKQKKIKNHVLGLYALLIVEYN